MSNINPLQTTPVPPTEISTSHKAGFASALTRLPGTILEALYRWQDSGKTVKGGLTSFHDQSPSRGDGKIDYARPIWRR